MRQRLQDRREKTNHSARRVSRGKGGGEIRAEFDGLYSTRLCTFGKRNTNVLSVSCLCSGYSRLRRLLKAAFREGDAYTLPAPTGVPPAGSTLTRSRSYSPRVMRYDTPQSTREGSVMQRPELDAHCRMQDSDCALYSCKTSHDEAHVRQLAHAVRCVENIADRSWQKQFT